MENSQVSEANHPEENIPVDQQILRELKKMNGHIQNYMSDISGNMININKNIEHLNSNMLRMERKIDILIRDKKKEPKILVKEAKIKDNQGIKNDLVIDMSKKGEEIKEINPRKDNIPVNLDKEELEFSSRSNNIINNIKKIPAV